MAFNSDKFMDTSVVRSTGKVRMEVLKHWFDEGEEPIFVIQSLTSTELAKANETVDQTAQVQALIKALSTTNKQEMADGYTKALGLEGVPADVMKRIQMLCFGSQKPKIEQRVAVKIAEYWPVDFIRITNEIGLLSGQGGMVEGKSSPSGNMTESGLPAPLEKQEDASSTS